MANNYGKENGLHYLGEFDVDVKMTIGKDEKIAMAESHCAFLWQVEALQLTKKEQNKGINDEIKRQSEEAREVAKLIRNGYRIERRTLPCYLDTERGQRVFVDMDTGEELAREPMRDDDRQLKL